MFVFYYRLTHNEPKTAISKPKKHKIIASTYAKREKLNSEGHVSVSLHDSYDPVGEYPDLLCLIPVVYSEKHKVVKKQRDLECGIAKDIVVSRNIIYQKNSSKQLQEVENCQTLS